MDNTHPGHGHNAGGPADHYANKAYTHTHTHTVRELCTVVGTPSWWVVSSTAIHLSHGHPLRPTHRSLHPAELVAVSQHDDLIISNHCLNHQHPDCSPVHRGCSQCHITSIPTLSFSSSNRVILEPWVCGVPGILCPCMPSPARLSPIHLEDIGVSHRAAAAVMLMSSADRHWRRSWSAQLAGAFKPAGGASFKSSARWRRCRCRFIHRIAIPKKRRRRQSRESRRRAACAGRCASRGCRSPASR